MLVAALLPVSVFASELTLMHTNQLIADYPKDTTAIQQEKSDTIAKYKKDTPKDSCKANPNHDIHLNSIAPAPSTKSITEIKAHADNFANADSVSEGTTNSSLQFKEDDPYLITIDELIGESYFNSSCFETDARTMNVYGFSKDSVPQYDPEIYKQRLKTLDATTPLSLTYNKVTQKFIELYANRRRGQVSRMLGLAELYFPMFIEELDKQDLPQELKHLAIVESALNPRARSRSGAKGLWQFMYRTGQIYGLESTSYMDDRFDPYKSTVAACEYLGYLFGLYDNWELALAAYNSGPGRVNRAIRRSGGKRNYWELWRFLPKETRGYVPAFIAVNYVMEYATEHNIYPTSPKYFDYETDTVVIRNKVHFEQIAAVIDVPVDEISYLNPTFKMGLIPGVPGETYAITLPLNKIGDFINNEASIYAYADSTEEDSLLAQATKAGSPAKETVVWHHVKNGDVLGVIAEKYNCSVSEIKDWNNFASSRIYIGQKLIIYSTGKQQSSNNSKSQEKIAQVSASKYKYHTIQSGDTLWDIAKLYDGVTISQLKELNNINNEKRLKPGMKIKVSPISS